MAVPLEPLGTSITALMYFGDAVFALSGALLAGRKRMDIIGFVLIGTITGIGGGTVRDLLLGRTVWWTQQPLELILCVVVSLITFFVVRSTMMKHEFKSQVVSQDAARQDAVSQICSSFFVGDAWSGMEWSGVE